MANSLVANKMTVSIVVPRVTFSNSLIDSAQVQVDSIVQIERDSPILYGNCRHTTVTICIQYYSNHQNYHW